MTRRKPEEIADEIAAAMNADVLIYNGGIEPGPDRKLMKLARLRRRRPNVILILVTFGGDADCAYRIAKCLQSKYDHFTLFVTGYCKSAGTLVALGANELVFGDDGELGPLDVQMSKKDSLWEAQSGLTVYDSLVALQDKAYLAFEQFFLQTEDKSQGAITVKTASEIATSLAVGLFGPLYSQIDPIHVGEAARAMQVADHYGRRLAQKSQNFDFKGLDHLINHYPSHGFVIDIEEAESVFHHVRRPYELEAELAEALGPYALAPTPPDKTLVRFISTEQPAPSAEMADAITREVENDEDLETEITDASFDITPGGPNGREQEDSRETAPRSPAQPGTQPT